MVRSIFFSSINTLAPCTVFNTMYSAKVFIATRIEFCMSESKTKIFHINEKKKVKQKLNPCTL